MPEGILLSATPRLAPALRPYRREWLRPDLVAGVSLAAFAIPESMAYASLAGLPPEVGLHCYLLAGLGYALFGLSRQAAVGPTSAISLVIGASLGALAAPDPAQRLAMASITGVLAGLMGVIAWALRLGSLVNFVSLSALMGYKVGAGLLIASTQLPKLFGLHAEGANFFSRIAHLVTHLGQAHPVSSLVGCAGLALLLLGEWRFPSRPVVLPVVVLSILAVSLLGLPARGVHVIGELSGGLPSLRLSAAALAHLPNLVPLALACFLLSSVESLSVARTFAMKRGHPFDSNQEMLALGTANLAAGLGQGYPVAAGMSQSAVNDMAGARSPLSLLVTSGVVALLLLLFTGLLRNLAEPILAALVLAAIKDLINVRELTSLARVSRAEFAVGCVSLAGVLLLGILQGLLLATILSMLIVIQKMAHPHLAVLGRIPGTDQFGDVARHPDNRPIPGAILWRVEGSMFFFNADGIRQRAVHLAEQGGGSLRLAVLDLSATPEVDYASALMLKDLEEQLAARGTALRVAGGHGAVRERLRSLGLEKRVGPIERHITVRSIVAEHLGHALEAPTPSTELREDDRKPELRNDDTKREEGEETHEAP